MKPALAKDKEDEKVVKMGKEEAVIVGAEEKRPKMAVEESESQKRLENVRNIDLQVDLEKPERDTGMNNKLPQQVHKQQQQQPPPSKAAKEEPYGEKTGKLNGFRLSSSWLGQWLGIFFALSLF